MPNFSVILVEPKYQGNIGSVARVMKNLGFRNLVLINPPEIGGQARSMAMRGRDILENATILEKFDELEELFDFLIASSAVIAGDRNAMRTPIPPGELKNAMETDGEIGLVFGREDYGLFNGEIEACDVLVSIPANPEYPTFNLAQSAAILLYEVSRLEGEHDAKGHSNKPKKLKKLKRIDATEKRILLEKFDFLVDEIYNRDFERRLIKKTFRQLVGRAFISGREAFTLTGLFRRTLGRIEGIDKDRGDVINGEE